MKPTDTTLMLAELMWSPDLTKWTHISEFRKLVNQKYELKLESYHDLYDWSCTNYAVFWEEFWHYSQIVHSKSYDQVVDKRKNISEIPEWFKGARLNFAQNLLRFGGDKIALYAAGEGKNEVRTRTFDELRSRVVRYSAAMKALGICSGDRVVSYASNCIENVEAMLGAASLGAVWSATSPEFGATGVLERFCQIQPKLIFSVAAVTYNGRQHSHLEKLRQVAQGLPELIKVIIIPFVAGDRRTTDISNVKDGIWLDEFLSYGARIHDDDEDEDFVQLPFNHPLYIMYSSGTTGVPKCLVHSAGGTLIQHMKEHMFGNLTENDIIMFYTTTGWMMWNWLITALAMGASVVLYDGSPLASEGNILWDLVDQLNITILGTGAKCLSMMEEKGLQPIQTHNLSSLHTILSTGSPLKPQSYDYIYTQVKQDVMLSSISGGTDIIGCFMGPNPTLPVHRGEVQSCHLAMAMECWIDQNEPVLGQAGELVCTKPHPSMPIYFWNDPDGAKYRRAYFEEFKGVWCHGDFCLINPLTRGLVMLGRSDGTLNPNGVRFGSAEIYNIVESFGEIEDSLCVAQRNRTGDEERVVLFLKMMNGHLFSEELVKRIQVTIRAELSARHIPAHILETKDIPYTISGKKVEVAVRNVIEGKQVKYRGALANPDSLDLYKNIPQLREGKNEVRTRTFDELRSRVVRYSAAMKALGICSGDRVVSYASNCIENVEAMLGAASLGAVWSATSPEFGATGVLERFCQIQPKLIFSVAAVTYNGRQHSHLEKLRQVAQGLPELIKVIIIPFVAGDRRTTDISNVKDGIWLDEFLSYGARIHDDDEDEDFVQLPFNHPLYIMYSSGTTGVPKCLVHSAGGTLIQHMKEHMFGNLTENDIIMFYTTTGWMMWNWLITALAMGASVVLYDGSPLASEGNILWDLVDQLNITILGTGAKCLSVMEEKGLQPIQTHNLSSLHTILSTGSPLKPQSYDYIYTQVKKDVMLSSISGGTDIIGCFMGPNPTLPVHRGEVQSCHLAMAMECWIDQNEPVLGQAGELVCTKPHPSMPIYFWNDPDGAKYRRAYFEEFKGVWCHGDFCLINPLTRGLVMLGRSDGTLNPNGVRFGSAEIYNIVESFGEIEDSLCVAQRNRTGDEERVVLFLKMMNGHLFSEELVKRIQVTIRAELSARHIPAHILETKDIPYTISGKKVEVAVRNVIEGKQVKYRGALANPDSLDLYKNIPQLSNF